jgi:DNA-binding PucR family transcriptional regulator
VLLGGEPVRVRDLLDVPGLGLRLLTDVTGLDRPIRHVYTTDLPDPVRYLTQGDLVLTGMIWCREPGDADRFVRALAKAGASVLGAGEALGSVPPEVIEACGRHGIALLAVPPETSFASVTDEVGRRLNGDRATAMTRVLGRRRLLLSAVAEGAGLDEMFRLMGREIGVECWLLTGTGRVVGGTSAPLPRPVALRLAGEYVKADRLPVVTKAGDGDARYSLFAIGSEPRITSWFLACAGREHEWQHELRESVAELTADVALERARLDAGRAGDRKLAEAIVTRLAAEGSSPAETMSLMRAAELPPDGRYLVAALRAEAEARVGGAMAGERWRCALAEELSWPMAERTLVAPLGDEIIALISLPAGTDSGEQTPPAHAFAALLRAAQPVFEADRSRIRLSVGVSTPAAGVTALPGAQHEASSARRLAELRGALGGISVVTSDEVASHELLLASVPGSVTRSFRDRLLGPLLAYDEQHRAELLPTLREFLACSGSWNTCAAKMYVHVNTVRYRIRRIEELTERDLSSLDDRVDFFLALRIR